MPHCPVTVVQRYRDGVCSLLFHLFFIICHPYIPLHLEEMIFYTCIQTTRLLASGQTCVSVCVCVCVCVCCTMHALSIRYMLSFAFLLCLRTNFHFFPFFSLFLNLFIAELTLPSLAWPSWCDNRMCCYQLFCRQHHTTDRGLPSFVDWQAHLPNLFMSLRVLLLL